MAAISPQQCQLMSKLATVRALLLIIFGPLVLLILIVVTSYTNVTCPFPVLLRHASYIVQYDLAESLAVLCCRCARYFVCSRCRRVVQLFTNVWQRLGSKAPSDSKSIQTGDHDLHSPICFQYSAVLWMIAEARASSRSRADALYRPIQYTLL